MSDTFRKQYHTSVEQDFLIRDIKNAAEDLLDEIERIPSSRETSLAKTKLEEAVMWAVKGASTPKEKE